MDATEGSTELIYDVFRLQVYEKEQRDIFSPQYDRGQFLREALQFAVRSYQAGAGIIGIGDVRYVDGGAAFSVSFPSRQGGFALVEGVFQSTGGTLNPPITVVMDFDRELLGIARPNRFGRSAVTIANSIVSRLSIFAELNSMVVEIEANRLHDYGAFISQIESAAVVRRLTFTIKRPNPDYRGDILEGLERLRSAGDSDTVTATMYNLKQVDEFIHEALEQVADKGNPISARIETEEGSTPRTINLTKQEPTTVVFRPVLTDLDAQAAVVAVSGVLQGGKSQDGEELEKN